MGTFVALECWIEDAVQCRLGFDGGYRLSLQADVGPWVEARSTNSASAMPQMPNREGMAGAGFSVALVAAGFALEQVDVVHATIVADGNVDGTTLAGGPTSPCSALRAPQGYEGQFDSRKARIKLEAGVGIEPAYTDLQSAAWPLCHPARELRGLTGPMARRCARSLVSGSRLVSFRRGNLERETSLELATSTLARLRSTN